MTKFETVQKRKQRDADLTKIKSLQTSIADLRTQLEPMRKQAKAATKELARYIRMYNERNAEAKRLEEQMIQVRKGTATLLRGFRKLGSDSRLLLIRDFCKKFLGGDKA